MNTLISEIVVLLLLPITAMTLHENMYALRHAYAGAIIIYFLLRKYHLQLPSLKSNLRLPPSTTIAAVTSISLFIATLLILIDRLSPPIINNMVMTLINQPHLRLLSLIAYPLMSVPIQEILFRWFFLNYTKNNLHQYTHIVLLNAAVFSLVHLPFLSPLMLLGTFMLGIWWNHLTLKHQSLIPSLISHTLIGTVLLYLGLY